MKRLDFFSKAFTLCVGKGLEVLESNQILSALENLAKEKEEDGKKSERPPGASSSDRTFRELCTGCDACMISCPVNVVMIENLETRLPVIFPEEAPCIHCDGYPCVSSCPTEALSFNNLIVHPLPSG
jgi:ferredoxin